MSGESYRQSSLDSIKRELGHGLRLAKKNPDFHPALETQNGIVITQVGGNVIIKFPGNLTEKPEHKKAIDKVQRILVEAHGNTPSSSHHREADIQNNDQYLMYLIPANSIIEQAISAITNILQGADLITAQESETVNAGFKRSHESVAAAILAKRAEEAKTGRSGRE